MKGGCGCAVMEMVLVLVLVSCCWSLDPPDNAKARTVLYVLPESEWLTKVPHVKYPLNLDYKPGVDSFIGLPPTVDDALDQNWTAYKPGVCTTGKGYAYLPWNSVVYTNSDVPLEDRNPLALFFDSKGFLAGVQIYLNYSTCCSFAPPPNHCKCPSSHASFPVQRFYPTTTFIDTNPQTCSRCTAALFFGTNKTRAAFPGFETQSHHFTHLTWRDPDQICSSTATKFYADRFLVGIEVPENTYFQYKGGYVWTALTFNPAPYGYFDSKDCVTLMGIHVLLMPTPNELGSFSYFPMYRGLDLSQRFYGVHLNFGGQAQPYNMFENFQQVVQTPEPVASFHVWFGNYDEDIKDGANCPSPIVLPSYRKPSGLGNNLKVNPRWGSAFSQYTQQIPEANDHDYHAHWGYTPEFAGRLGECEYLADYLDLGSIAGGGVRVTPGIIHTYTFGDPVYFCRWLLNAVHQNESYAADAPVLPHPREVSNQLFSRRGRRSSRFTNDLHTYMGQFISIDIISSSGDESEFAIYYYPPCDKHRDSACVCCADPISNPGYCLFANSNCWSVVPRYGNVVYYPEFFAPFQQVTAQNPRKIGSYNSMFMDLTNIYGNDETTLQLRDADDPAKLALNAPRYTGIPIFFGTALERGDTAGTQWDFRGDYRANKVPQQKIITDLWISNHNRLVDELEAADPEKYDVTTNSYARHYLYEDARRLNIAVYQRTVFREYLGVLIGRPLDPYDTNKDGEAASRARPGLKFSNTYDPDLNPSVDVIMSLAAYRAGHTEMNTLITRLNKFFDPSEYPDILLRDTYWNLTTVEEYETSAADIIRGLVASRQAEVGTSASDDIRNFLFFEWNKGADLISMNIFRGRENGIPPINVIREYYGLEPYDSCDNLTSDEATQAVLKNLYGEDCINRIDFYVAGLLEEHMPLATVGETFYNIYFEQFTKIRNGDRFYYENQAPTTDENPYQGNPLPFTDEELAYVYSTTLEQVFANNLPDIEVGQLGAGIFFMKQRQLQTLQNGGAFVDVDFVNITNNLTEPWNAEFFNFFKLSNSYGFFYLIKDGVFYGQIELAITGTSLWAGFGVQPDQNTMKNADIVFCQYFYNNNSFNITDRYALDVGPPILDTDLEGGESNILEADLLVIDKLVIFRFARPVTSEDPWDKNISETGTTKTMYAFNPESAELVYHGPTRQSDIFLGLADTYPVDEVSDAIIIIFGVLGGLCVLFALFIILSIAMKEEYFKFMSPLFCQLLCVGAMVCVSAVFPLMKQPPSSNSCMAYPWLAGLGFSILFGCLFAKTWRLWRLFSSKSLKAQVISNGLVLKIVILSVIPMAILLIVWNAVDGCDPERQYVDPYIAGSPNNVVQDICVCETHWWAIFAGMCGFVLLIGCILTFLIRNLPPEFNDAEPIGFSMYNATLMLAIGCAIGWGFDDNVQAQVAVQGFTVLFMVWFTLIVLFVPTLYRMWITKEEPRSFQSSMAMRSGGSNVSGLNTSTAGGTSAES